MKPKGLLETTILMAVCNPLGLFFLEPSRGAVAAQILAGAVIVGVSYLVLWYYWSGRNWARILVLITSVVALLNLLAFPSASALQRIILILEAVLGAFLLVWLNRKPAREFFRQRVAPPASPAREASQ